MDGDTRTRAARRLTDLGIVLLGGALPLSLAVSNLALALSTLGLLTALAVGAAPPAAVRRIAGAARDPLALALAGYAAASLVAGLNGLDASRSLALWPKDLHKLWVFLLLAAVIDARRRVLFARALAAGAAVAALSGVAQTLTAVAAIASAESRWGVDVASPYLRAKGFMHPVSYGEAMGLILFGLLFAGGRFLSGGRRRAALAAVAVALAVNQTRAVLVALLAGLAAAALLEQRWRRTLLVTTTVGAALIGVWEFLPTGRSLLELLRRGLADPQAARVTLWRVGWEIFRDHPWTGVGPGHYGAVFGSYFSGALDGQRIWTSAHNLFLQQAAERGLLGLAALCGVAAALAAGARRRVREGLDDWGLWALSALAAFFVMNLTETAFQTEQVATLFLAVWVVGKTQPGPEFL